MQQLEQDLWHLEIKLFDGWLFSPTRMVMLNGKTKNINRHIS
jgi:hypothetical protein